MRSTFVNFFFRPVDFFWLTDLAQIPSLYRLNIQHWQEEHSKARERDEAELSIKLSALESNQSQLGLRLSMSFVLIFVV